MSRHCTMLAIPWFREWFERRYGEACKSHDLEYKLKAMSKIKADLMLFKRIKEKGRWFDTALSVLTILAVQLPWVWWAYKNARAL